MYSMRIKVYIAMLIFTLAFIVGHCSQAKAAKPEVKAKFYDFSEQLIDGEVKQPTTLYMDSRQEVKFRRLLRLKRTFKRELQRTSRYRIFK